MRSKITIGTRASALAIAQTSWVANTLRAAHPDITIELKTYTSRGDTITGVPLAQIGGTGVFTKELEVAILDRRVDMAVHSLKDLTIELPEGLLVACVPPRENPSDALVVAKGTARVGDLPTGAIVGTSSARRAAQLLAVRPDLKTADIRGNVDTRLSKLAKGQYSAIVLSRAGLNRLGFSITFPNEDIPFDVMLPAPGQGALALEARADDTELLELLAELNDDESAAAVNAERRLLALLGGGCHMPLGAWARNEAGRLVLDAVVCAVDGRKVIRASGLAGLDEWHLASDQAYEKLVQQGAKELLECDQQS